MVYNGIVDGYIMSNSDFTGLHQLVSNSLIVKSIRFTKLR